ncbi:hypothetical protein HK100_009242 [Physocladia obscura]|uniref:Nephrocystin 3-like N-terminal domain-containing protein n=1 Tax=Physocladia obscura TaxID=109957 RepID=A0AAD5T9G1_9FUNG|nr:hypothetical protein HK100_009242 [Physocladia obscura]
MLALMFFLSSAFSYFELQISKEFSVAEGNLKLFHYPTEQIEKRRVLSEAANLQKVLSKVKMPSADITFDFAHNVHIVAVYDPEVPCEICITNVQVENVCEELDDVKALRESYIGKPFLITAGLLYAGFNECASDSPEWTNAFKILATQIHTRVPRFAAIGIKISKLKQWLNPVDFTTDIAKYAEEYDCQPCLWVNEFLEEWLVTDEGYWWLKGGAGTGKLIIAYSIIVNHLQDKFIIGSQFFCQHNDEHKCNPLSVIWTMAWDLTTISRIS